MHAGPAAAPEGSGSAPAEEWTAGLMPPDPAAASACRIQLGEEARP